jgi:hypothetical protein
VKGGGVGRDGAETLIDGFGEQDDAGYIAQQDASYRAGIRSMNPFDSYRKRILVFLQKDKFHLFCKIKRVAK